MANSLAHQNGIDKREGLFVEHYGQHGDLAAAISFAGYVMPQDQKGNFGRHLLRRPKITLALHAEVSRLLASDAVVARAVVRQIITDKSVSAKTRGDMAIKLLDRAGHGVPKAADNERGIEREIHEMTAGELRALVGQYEDEIARRAKPISALPAQVIDQHADLLE